MTTYAFFVRTPKRRLPKVKRIEAISYLYAKQTLINKGYEVLAPATV